MKNCPNVFELEDKIKIDSVKYLLKKTPKGKVPGIS